MNGQTDAQCSKLLFHLNVEIYFRFAAHLKASIDSIHRFTVMYKYMYALYVVKNSINAQRVELQQCHKLMDHKYFLNRHHRVTRVEDVNGSVMRSCTIDEKPMKCNYFVSYMRLVFFKYHAYAYTYQSVYF